MLPIVEPRTIPVKAFVVEPPPKYARLRWTENTIGCFISEANEIFSQVGISFVLDGAIHPVGTSDDWNLDALIRVPQSLSRSGYAASDATRRLLAVHNTNSCNAVGMFFVGTLKPANLGAFRNESSVVIPRNASAVTVAHELGHYLGLRDSYDYWKWKRNGAVCRIDIDGGFDPVRGEVFGFHPQDWGSEAGNGFYWQGDSCAGIIRKFLMYGYTSSDAVDIPHGTIKGLRPQARLGSEKENAEIGAAFIK